MANWYNTYVARVLREFGYIRELREGIRRIVELMQSNDLVKPKLESPNKSFIVTLFHKYVYTKEEKMWLDLFENFNLSRGQKTVVRQGMNGRLISAKEIFDEVGIRDTDAYRQLLESLKVLGILASHYTNPQVSGLAMQAKLKVKELDRKAIPRFEIKIPGKARTASQELRDDADYEKIYVGNLPVRCTASQLREAFEQFGEISDIVMPKAGQTNTNKGFAFVEFADGLSVQKALSYNKPHVKFRRSYLG